MKISITDREVHRGRHADKNHEAGDWSPAATVYVQARDVMDVPPTLSSQPARTVTVPAVLHVNELEP